MVLGKPKITCFIEPAVFIKKLFQNKFFRNVATLASGTALAQILGFAFIPILSRTYSQEAFGILASYAAVVSLVSSFATLKYDTALILPKEDKSAYALLKLSNILTIGITTVCCLFLFLPFPFFEEYRGLEVYIAFGAILSINYNNSALWNIRFKQFNITSISKIVQAVGVFVFQLILFQFFELKGLVFGNILGVLIAGIYLVVYRKLDWKIYTKITKKEMIAEAKRYIDFPKYFTLSNMVLSLSANLPILLFVNYISLFQLGLYGMAFKVIGQPVNLISSSFQSVILSNMADRRNDGIPILKWYIQMILFLLMVSIIISSVIIFFGPLLIKLFLGSDWVEVGLYIKMLIPLLISMMISSPGTAAVRVFEMQKYTLKYSIVSLVIKVIALGWLFWRDVQFTELILIYSCVVLSTTIANNLIILSRISIYEKVIKDGF